MADIWSFPLVVETIPDEGGHYELTADEQVRESLAKLAGLRSLPRLGAVFDVYRRGAGVEVVGEVRATVGQTCVVTLEPLENEVLEKVDLAFAAEGDVPGDKNDDDAPESLIGGTLDLGAVATEFLVLGIDLYPRKPGVAFSSPASPGDAREKPESPFAVLAALKERSGRNLK